MLIVTDPADPGLQHRFVGLLSTAAQRASVRDIPGFGDEIAADLHLTGTMVHSHYGRAARTTLESLPRDLVLELSAAEVADLVGEIVGLQERRLVRVFEVPEPVGLWTTVLVYFPRSRFTAELPAQLADTVAAAYGAEQRTFESFVGASSLARVTVSVRRPTAAAAADLEALERAIDLQTTSWNDRLRAAATVELGDREGRRLFERFAASSSPAYRAAVAPERAVADLRRVGEMVDDGAGLATSLDHDPEAAAAEWRFRVYRRGTPMMLSELLPLLDHLGFTALDEQPYTFSVDEGSPDSGRSGLGRGAPVRHRGPRARRGGARRRPGGRHPRGVRRSRRGRGRERRLQPPRAARRARRPRGRRCCAPTPSTCARSASPSASRTSRRRSPSTPSLARDLVELFARPLRPLPSGRWPRRRRRPALSRDDRSRRSTPCPASTRTASAAASSR